MKCCYVAGPYSAPNVIDALHNIRRGQRAATEMLLKGYAVFVPWLDHQLFLQLRGDEKISLETIQAHSMAWLSKSDLVYVLRGWETSKGTLAEIQRAEALGIPVSYEGAEKSKCCGDFLCEAFSGVYMANVDFCLKCHKEA